jgi:hypothetical protein
MHKRHILTFARANELLTYNRRSGLLRWRVDRCTGEYASVLNAKAGDVAGTVRADGRIQIKIDGLFFYAHQLAWLLRSGEWPPEGMTIDHKDGNVANNRWANLRLATRSQNMCNRGKPPNNVSGLKGVSRYRRHGKHSARITVRGRAQLLGYFTHPEEAHAAYREAAKRLHGKFTNFGMSDHEWDRRWRWFLCARVWVD